MWQSVRVPFLTIVFALLSLFVFTKIFGPIPFSVNSITTTKTDLFTVTQTAEVSAIPDTASILLGVNKNEPTVEKAQDEVNSIINQITEELKKLGVDEKDIKTNNYSINPVYNFETGSESITGYSVNANITIRFDSVDQANEAIDLATNIGATNVGGVEFIINDDKQKELEDQARREAIKKAKEKAESIADAAGIKLGRIVNVQENNNQEPPVIFNRQQDNAISEKSNPTQLTPGENIVTSTITLSYETY